MIVFKIIDRPYPEEPDRAQGGVRAETYQAARELVGEEVLLFKRPRMQWPGETGNGVAWTRRA